MEMGEARATTAVYQHGTAPLVVPATCEMVSFASPAHYCMHLARLQLHGHPQRCTGRFGRSGSTLLASACWLPVPPQRCDLVSPSPCVAPSATACRPPPLPHQCRALVSSCPCVAPASPRHPTYYICI